MKSWIAAGLMVLGAQAATAQVIDARNPANVSKAMAELGHKINPADNKGGYPMFTAEINGWNTAVVFGGCTGNTNCKYMLLVSSFSDLTNPPADWINKVNADLDLGKVWVNEEKTLSFSQPVAIGEGQLQRDTLRYVLDQWGGIVRYLSKAATDAKLVK